MLRGHGIHRVEAKVRALVSHVARHTTEPASRQRESIAVVFFNQRTALYSVSRRTCLKTPSRTSKVWSLRAADWHRGCWTSVRDHDRDQRALWRMWSPNVTFGAFQADDKCLRRCAPGSAWLSNSSPLQTDGLQTVQSDDGRSTWETQSWHQSSFVSPSL